MFPIEHYLLARSDGTSTTVVSICDEFPYVGYQLYVDDTLVWEDTAQSFTVEIPVNKKVDVIGLEEYDVPGTDFSSYLDDSFGDKVRFDISTAEQLLESESDGLNLRFYSDNRTGTIDYSTPIYDIADIQASSIVFTGRLQSGTYRFGVRAYNGSGCESAAFEWSQTIDTRPDEITPRIVSYNASTDTLILTAGRNDIGAGYNVYTGFWGQGDCSINYYVPMYSSITETITVVGIRGTETAGTISIAVRETLNGLEEKNFNILHLTVAAAEWVGNQPAPPTDLTGTITGCDNVMLTWQYDPDAVPVPAGFHIYSGNNLSWETMAADDWGIFTSAVFDTFTSNPTPMDYSTPLATVPFHFKVNAFYTVGPIFEDTAFSIRAFIGSNESQNVDQITVTPLATPETPSGTASVTWEDS